QIVATLDSKAHGVHCAVFSGDGRFLATAGIDRRIRVWETVTGSVAQTHEGHESQVHCLAFAADGRMLASGSEDTTVLLWDVRPDAAPAAGEPEQLWKELAERDVVRARRAMASFVAAPEKAVPFLKERLKPVPAPDDKRIQQLIADL